MKNSDTPYTPKSIASYAEEPNSLYMSLPQNKSLVLSLLEGDISSKELLSQLLQITGLTIQNLAKSIFEITPKTFIKYKNNDVKLPSRIAELAIELNALYELGNEIFGNNAQFNLWLEAPNVFFGEKRPKNYLNTSSGISLIYEELKRIEFGATA